MVKNRGCHLRNAILKGLLQELCYRDNRFEIDDAPGASVVD